MTMRRVKVPRAVSPSPSAWLGGPRSGVDLSRRLPQPAPTGLGGSSPCLHRARAPSSSACLPLRSAPIAAGSLRGSPQFRLGSRSYASSTEAADSDPASQHLSTSQIDPVEDADIVIVGGGSVGLALASGLASAGASSSMCASLPTITLVEAADLSKCRTWASEKRALRNKAGPSSESDRIDWENRVVSLTSENMQWLQSVGAYDFLVKHRLRSVQSMRVWDGLSGAVLDFDSAELRNAMGGDSGTPQISVMVEISNLQQALLRYLEQGSARQQVTIKDRSRVQNIVPGLEALHPDQAASTPLGNENDPWPVLELASNAPGAPTSVLRARLLVGADGPNSPVRTYAGIGGYGWPYGRRGLVATLRCAGPQSGEPPVGRIAWQRFLPSGTIAFLPLSDQTGSMVWALEPEVAQALTVLHRQTAGGSTEPLAKLVDAAFRLPWSYLERVFARAVGLLRDSGPEDRAIDWSWMTEMIPSEADYVDLTGLSLPEASAGDVPPKVQSIDAKSVASFPLQLRHADAYLGSSLNGSTLSVSGLLAGALSVVGLAAEGAGQGGGRSRTALVGDAAHTIHPLAGQGLNLGIADVRCLTKVIEDARRAGADLGSFNALSAYPRERYWENQKMLSAVDHLHWLYAGIPVPLLHQADGGRRSMEHDGLLRGLAKEGIARGTVWARSTGLEVINELGFAKNAFMRQAGSTSSSSGSRSGAVSGQRRVLSTLARRPASSMRIGQATSVPKRNHSSAKSQSGAPLASDAYTKDFGTGPATTSTPSLSSLTSEQRRALDDMLRVDHSGEVAANTIYEGQADMFGALGDIKNRDMAREMWSTEKKHLEVMRVLLQQHNVRPSLLLPVWAVAGRVLGGVTALLGPRSAMACTEAVETVIGEHYDDQLAALSTILKQDLRTANSSSVAGPQSSGAETLGSDAREDAVHPSLPLLSEIIEEFRDDELEHLDTAVEHESQQAAGHALLSAVVAAGCKGAIWVAAKI